MNILGIELNNKEAVIALISYEFAYSMSKNAELEVLSLEKVKPLKAFRVFNFK